MKLNLGFLVVVAAVSVQGFAAGISLEGISTEIIGGQPVSSGDPAMTSTVLIVGSETARGPNGQTGTEQFICTGSIIANDLVLTAAHCLGQDGHATLQVGFRANIQGAGPIIGVLAQTRPSDYLTLAAHSPVDQDDLGLLRLAQPIPAGYAPAHILTDPSALQEGTTILLAGYGIDVPVAPSNPKDMGGAGVLREVQQQIINPHYGNTEVLVSLADGRGACHGDSGGPAFIESNGELFLFGVTSRLTNDDPETRSGAQVEVSCSVDMVYTNVLARAAWINQAAAQLENYTPGPSQQPGASGQPQPDPGSDEPGQEPTTKHHHRG